MRSILLKWPAISKRKLTSGKRKLPRIQSLPWINKFSLRILLSTVFHTAIAKLMDLMWERKIIPYPYSKPLSNSKQYRFWLQDLKLPCWEVRDR